MKSKTVTNISIVGCGAVAELLYMPALMGIENIKIKYLVDPNLDFCEVIKDKFNLKDTLCIDSIPSAENNDDIALVLVPTGLHEYISSDCLNKGYHVICEKPLASNSMEVENLIRISNDLNKHLGVGMARRFMPHNQVVKELISNRSFGDIKRIYFEEGGAFSWPVKTIARFDSSKSGNGAALNGTASHLIDLILWWAGDSITFEEFQDDSFGGLDINCRIKFKIKNDVNDIPVEGLISMTGDLKNNFIIFFDKSYLVVPIFPNEKIKLYDPLLKDYPFEFNPYSTKTEYNYDSIRRHIQKFINAVNGEKKQNNYIEGSTQRSLTKLIDDAYSNRKKFDFSWM